MKLLKDYAVTWQDLYPRKMILLQPENEWERRHGGPWCDAMATEDDAGGLPV